MMQQTLPKLQSGWTYTLSGKPCAYLVDPNRPDSAEIHTFEAWWHALHYAVVYAEVYPRCDYIGGPHE